MPPADMEEFIESQHTAGLTIMETIKAVMQTYNMSLGQAKLAVSAHKSWQSIVRAAEPLHSDLERIKNEKNDERKRGGS
jgi:hypothetical protein